MDGRARIAVFAGPLATIMNTPPLVSQDNGGTLRPQMLAQDAVVYVRRWSAHPLEEDAGDLYGPPDGWLTDGVVSPSRVDERSVPVDRAVLRADSRLYPLPYVARPAGGQGWGHAGLNEQSPASETRQTFFPDAQRLYQEIDELGIDEQGRSGTVFSQAEFAHIRPLPSAGFRTAAGERLGREYFPYFPFHLRAEPSMSDLARATNTVQGVLETGEFAGAQWLEGSASVEESLYWLSLLVDTTVPFVGHSAQRMHQSIGSDGAQNIVDGVRYILSGVSVDSQGRDRVGAVLVVDGVGFGARDVTKVDSRPGGYGSSGLNGGPWVELGGDVPRVVVVPQRRHTHRSLVRMTCLPEMVSGIRGSLGAGRSTLEVVPVQVTRARRLVPQSLPCVSIHKFGRYAQVGVVEGERPNPEVEVEVMARIRHNVAKEPLAGLVCEGVSPFGATTATSVAALEVAVMCGMPVVRVGRGMPGGSVRKQNPLFIAGDDLSSVKARMLLTAGLLRWGALPCADNPFAPREDEVAASAQAVARYQELFDTH